MNKKNIPIILIVSVLISLFTYYVLNSFVYAGINLLVVSISMFICLKENDKTNLKLSRIENAYNFINLLNVQMLATKNVYQAYRQIENYTHVDFAGIDNDSFHEQLSEIADKYDISAFKMYIKSLIIYDNEGGNFSKSEEVPSSLILKNKVYYQKLKNDKLLRLIDITTMYLLSFLIIIFLKSSLNSYYNLMIQNTLFSILLEVILLLAIASYIIAFIVFCRNKIKGL